MAETMQIDRLIKDPARISIAKPKVFARYRNKLGPIVGCSLHMGNWELAIWPLTIAGANPAAVYRSVNNPYVDQYLRAQRKDLYPGGLFGRGRVEGDHGESQKTARAIMDFVRQGGRLGVVCDLWDSTGLARAVLRQGRADRHHSRHDRPAHGRPHLALALRPPGQRQPLRHRAQGTQGAPHRQPRRRRQMDHGRDDPAVRGVGARIPRAVDVVEPALELMRGAKRRDATTGSAANVRLDADKAFRPYRSLLTLAIKE